MQTFLLQNAKCTPPDKSSKTWRPDWSLPKRSLKKKNPKQTSVQFWNNILWTHETEITVYGAWRREGSARDLKRTTSYLLMWFELWGKQKDEFYKAYWDANSATRNVLLRRPESLLRQRSGKFCRSPSRSPGPIRAESNRAGDKTASCVKYWK